MPDPFDQITSPLKDEGMTAEAATLACVGQEAMRVGTFYLTLRSLSTEEGERIKASHALKLTHHWVDIVNDQADEDEE